MRHASFPPEQDQFTTEREYEYILEQAVDEYQFIRLYNIELPINLEQIEYDVDNSYYRLPLAMYTADRNFTRFHNCSISTNGNLSEIVQIVEYNDSGQTACSLAALARGGVSTAPYHITNPTHIIIPMERAIAREYNNELRLFITATPTFPYIQLEHGSRHLGLWDDDVLRRGLITNYHCFSITDGRGNVLWQMGLGGQINSDGTPSTKSGSYKIRSNINRIKPKQ